MPITINNVELVGPINRGLSQIPGGEGLLALVEFSAVGASAIRVWQATSLALAVERAASLLSAAAPPGVTRALAYTQAGITAADRERLAGRLLGAGQPKNYAAVRS